MSEVETRLAEIRERAATERQRVTEMRSTWHAKYKDVPPFGAFALGDVEWLLDQLARVRTNTIEECAKAVGRAEVGPQAWGGFMDDTQAQMRDQSYRAGVTTARSAILAAVRGVSHEH